MPILEQLIHSIQRDAPVRQVIVSTHSTLVCSRGCGLAATQLSSKPHGEDAIRDAGQLHLKSVKELAIYALSDNPLEASIGLAAINSMINVDHTFLKPLDAVDLAIKLATGKRVIFVGHFPFIPKIRTVANDCKVIELNPNEGEFGPACAGDLLPKAEVVVITAATLITHALEVYLAFCNPKATVMLSGPSTPLSPQMFEHPIDILSGIIVEDEEKVIQAVSQGANIKQMWGIRKLSMFKSL